MGLPEWIKLLPGFRALSVNDKLVIFGYFINVNQSVTRFGASDINACFDLLHLDRPSNASSQLGVMSRGAGKKLLKDSAGFRLTSDAREWVARKLPSEQSPKEILLDLQKLEASITDPQQKVFLHEALVCFANAAYRASIVMAWNLAYHHVTKFIFDNHLAAFSARLKIQYPNEKLVISKFTDFEDMKESMFIAVIKGGGLVASATAKTMKAKLDIRNSAAHPSSTIVAPITAEEVITDLVRNILLRPVL